MYNTAAYKWFKKPGSIKALSISLLCLLFYSMQAACQTPVKGLYKTAHDYLNDSLSFTGKHTRIRTHELFKKNYIAVTFNDSTYTYLKNAVYGYKDKEGTTFRFFNNAIYTLINPGEQILLYKRTSGTGMKNSPFVDLYFFSKDAGAEVMPLTLANVARTFAANRSFVTLAEICFHNDNDLPAYDLVHHQYRLNRLLELAGAMP